jgi:hypothetical protein
MPRFRRLSRLGYRHAEACRDNLLDAIWLEINSKHKYPEMEYITIDAKRVALSAATGLSPSATKCADIAAIHHRDRFLAPWRLNGESGVAVGRPIVA